MDKKINNGTVLKYIGIGLLLLVLIEFHFLYTHQTMVMTFLSFFSFMGLYIIVIVAFVIFSLFTIAYGIAAIIIGNNVEDFMKEKCPICPDRSSCAGSVSEAATCLKKQVKENKLKV